MGSARIQQTTFIAGSIMASTAFISILGVMMTLGARALWTNLCALVLALVFLVALSLLSKTSILDMAIKSPPRWVNTAAGVRLADKENGHSARPADGGILKWQPTFISQGTITFMLLFSMGASVCRAIAVIIAANAGSSSLIPMQAIQYAQQEGFISRIFMGLGFDILMVSASVFLARKKHELAGAPFFTILFALLSASTYISQRGSTPPKTTFVDPVSGRVRRIYRDADESFEPSAVKATSKVSNTVGAAAGA